MDRRAFGCLVLMFMAAGIGYVYGSGFGHPWIGAVAAVILPWGFYGGIWFLALLQDTWRPAKPTCRHGVCRSHDDYTPRSREGEASVLVCRCGDEYVLDGTYSSSRTFRFRSPDGLSHPYLICGRHGRWRPDPEADGKTDGAAGANVAVPKSFGREVLAEFRLSMHHRRLRRKAYRRVAALGFGTRDGEKFYRDLNENTAVALYIFSRSHADGSLTLVPSLTYSLRELERLLYGRLRAPRESYCQLGSFGFQLSRLAATEPPPQWELDGSEQDAAVLDGLARYVEEIVTPFIETHQHLPELLKFIDSEIAAGETIWFPVLYYRLPLLYFLAGRKEDAEKVIAGNLERMKSLDGYSRALHASYVQRLRAFIGRGDKNCSGNASAPDG